MPPIKVILADDHPIIRAGFRLVVAGFDGVEVVGEASDGREAVELVATHRPRLALMDLDMPGLGGVEATRRIAKEYPDVRVIILSMHTGEEYVLDALRAGAAGYVPKDSPPPQLELAIRSVARGEIFLSPIISKYLVNVCLDRSSGQASSVEPLTSRQREILQLVAEGHSSKQIAGILNAGVKTIDSHRVSIMKRLAIRNVPGLVRYAIRSGLISME
jgi:DNA-binding NarL/FixJ family response regulator